MSELEISRALQSHAAEEGALVVMPKSPMVSKTLFLSVLNIVVGITTYLVGPDVVKNYPAEFVSAVMIINGIASAILRVFTNSPLTISPGLPPSQFGSFLVVALAGLMCSGSSFAQETAAPAAKPAIIKLAPSFGEPKAQSTEASSPSDSVGRPPAFALLPGADRVGERRLTIRERREIRRKAGLDFAGLAAVAEELKQEGEIDKDISDDEAIAAVFVRVREKNAKEFEGLSANDLQPFVDIVERWWPAIKVLLGFLGVIS